jgi:hypothetical protein
LPGAETPPGQLLENLCLGVQAGGEALEAEPDQGGANACPGPSPRKGLLEDNAVWPFV